ncbi:MAG: hypothetical protein KY445_05105 [Armatimonadetes bacterium]|nr:hypothetical protein [Armatimonadota bacterium]
MKIRFYSVAMLFLALGVPLLKGCGGSSNGSSNVPLPVQPPPASADQFAVVARSTQTQWRDGTPVALEIEVKNVSDRAATLQFPSGQSFDFAATREGETQPVWRWSMDKVFTQVFRSQTLSAGQSLKFSARWEDPSPGRYRIVGTIAANGGIDAAPFTIEIVP